MPTFPRTKKPQKVSPFEVPTGLVSPGQTGKVQLRTTLQVGRLWTEEWGPLKAGEPVAAELLAWIRWAYHSQQIFDITHLLTPGSGKAPNGAGGGAPVVNGASQSGSVLQTSGWTASVAYIVRAGDVIRIAGLNLLYEIVESAGSNASGQVTLTISPPIPPGSSPANAAAITRTGCTLRAMIWERPLIPAAGPGEFIAGLRLTFREVP